VNQPITFAEVAPPLAAGGYRPFPGLQETKVPALKNWNRLNSEPWDPVDLAETICKYSPYENYCACLAVQPELAVIDIDIVDPAHAEYADRLADDILGRTPLKRIGLSPKQLRVYRSGSGIRSRKIHPIEIFAGSGQFVAFGWHARAGRPYIWTEASPLEVPADSDRIPALTQAQIDRFLGEVFKVVPRRMLQSRSNGRGAAQTISERLRMLTTLYGSWKRAAAKVLGEAVEGIRNETAWAVVTSAAGRGISEDDLWRLFDRFFTGWELTADDGGVTAEQLQSMIERTKRPIVSPFRFGGR
jgi:hypothetical protein